MKKNDTTKKKSYLLPGIASGVCILTLAAIGFLQDKPQNTFVPDVQKNESTDNWEEAAASVPVEKTLQTPSPETVSTIIGTKTDRIQTILQEDDNGYTVSFSPAVTTPEDAVPPEPPVPTGDLSNPDEKPEYKPDPTPGPATPDGPGHPCPGFDPRTGWTYDPVFGWISPGTTTQDTVDNSGDINLQIGNM